MIICGYINGIFQVLSQIRYDEWKQTHPQVKDEIVIADAAFHMIPKMNASYLPNILAYLFIGFTAVRFFVTPYRWIILRRYFFLQSIIYLIRGVCIYTTLIPDPSGMPSTVNTQNIFTESLLIFLGIHRIECNMMFSGIISSMVLCACVWHHYSHKAPIIQFDLDNSPNSTVYGYPLRMTFVKLVVWVTLFICFIFYIACRLHYVADIFVAFMFTLFLFKVYHNYIIMSSTRNDIVNSFFKWFESDAVDIPTVMEYPNENVSQ